MHDFEAPIIKETVWFRLKVANVLLKHALANRETRDPILVPFFHTQLRFTCFDGCGHCLYQWTHLGAVSLPKMIPPLESRQQTMIEASFIGNFVLMSNHSFLFSAAEGFECVCRLDDTSIHELSFGKKNKPCRKRNLTEERYSCWLWSLFVVSALVAVQALGLRNSSAVCVRSTVGRE